MPLRKVCFALLATLSLVLVGCSSQFKIVPVTGTVTTEDGKPLDKISVEFFPVTGGPKSTGVTDAEGKFTLETVEGEVGAVAGEHKVVLRDAAVNGGKFLGRAGEDMDMSEGRKPRIAGKYTSIDQSGLTATITAGGEGPTFKAAAK